MKLLTTLVALLAVRASALLSVRSDSCVAEDLKHRVAFQNRLASSCVDMCKEIGAYPKCECPDFAPPDSTPGVMTWEELNEHMDNLVAWGVDMIKKWKGRAAAMIQHKLAAHVHVAALSSSDSKACLADDLKHRVQVQNKLASACVDMCKEIGAYPKCDCPDFAPPDSTPGVMTWDELLDHMDNLVDWGAGMIKTWKGRATAMIQHNSSWAPQPCDELEPGVPCTSLYKHPQGSGTVMPCPLEKQTRPDGCSALFKGKADGTQCPQISCPKALGVTMKLVCAGGCCPTCWAPDHVVKLDRHTSVDDAKVVPIAPQAPKSCVNAKCFELLCDENFKQGYKQGDCCYSCVPGR